MTMTAASGGGPWPVPSLPPPLPKSPPAYPDLQGKRRDLLKVQMLERDAVYLEEELKFVQGLQPASLGCKEVVEFVTANSDPLVPISERRPRCRWFLKLVRGGAICVSWIWCSRGGCRKPCTKCDCLSCPSRSLSQCCCCNCKGCFGNNWCRDVGCVSSRLKWPGGNMSFPDCYCKCGPKFPKLNVNCFGCCCCCFKIKCWNPLPGCFCF